MFTLVYHLVELIEGVYMLYMLYEVKHGACGVILTACFVVHYRELIFAFSLFRQSMQKRSKRNKRRN